MSDAATSVQKEMASCLQLQRSRCALYHAWDVEFQTVVSGSSSPEASAQWNQTLTSEFQRINSAIRLLQETVRGELDNIKKNGGGGSSSSNTFCTERQFIVDWVDRLQAVEREHFNAAVEIAAVLAAHAGPNAVGRQQEKAKAAQHQHAEDKKELTVSEALKEIDAQRKKQEENANNNNNNSGAAAMIENSVEGTTSSAPSPAGTNQKEAEEREEWSAKYSVHDRHGCIFHSVLPPKATKAILFADCGDADDFLLDGDDNEDVNGVEAEMGSITIPGPSASRRGGADITITYDMPAVQRRCRLCAQRIVPLLKRRKQLEADAADLADEMQCEITDLII